MKKYKQHFSSMDNCLYDEEIEKVMIKKQRLNKKFLQVLSKYRISLKIKHRSFDLSLD